MKHFLAVGWGDSRIPLVATAIHDGHRVRGDLLEIMAAGEAERLREEDPFTSLWTTVADARVIGRHSRFEVELNRPREKAVYLNPEDSWGLQIWRVKPGPELQAESLEMYDRFYGELRRGLEIMRRRHGRFVVFDLHSYNHRREGPGGPQADPEANPEVNVGTGTMERTRWAPIIDRFMTDLRNFSFLGRNLDVRENIKFKGGHMSRWIHENFPDSACCMAIEFKKFFMDEWTGEPDEDQLKAIGEALESTVPGVLQELGRLAAR